MGQYANYFYEVGMLAHTPRSGFYFLGGGRQSVAEHCFRMLHIAFALNRLVETPVDELQLFKLVMFHDLPEARTGDLNYENQKYVRVDDAKLLAEIEDELPYGAEIAGYAREYETRATAAALLAYDADQLEFLLTVKEEQDRGNPLAADWLPPVLARLKSAAAKQLAAEILSTRSDDWWFHNKGDEHWVTRTRRA
jgi:putative hydrolase of HD superfamily